MPEEYTLEHLHGLETDPEIEKKVAQSLELPAGTYNSQPELSLTIREGGPDTQHPGRKSARYYGFFKGVGVREEGEPGERDLPFMDPQPQGRTAFSVSWEYRDHIDWETKVVTVGKPDNQSKLWHQACQVYRLVNQLDRKATVQVADVVAYLQKYPVAVRFMKGDDSNIALAITRAKE